MSRSAPVKLGLISSLTTFGALLRYLRQRSQLTQRDLALATGYSISQISRLEQNERLPDEMTLQAVFVPALGLEQEPATAERLLALARRTRGATEVSPTPLEKSDASIHDRTPPQAAPRLTNLPYRLTSFIGRDQEVVALQRLVKDNRLVTLTGVGGVGKSSLALALGQTILDFGFRGRIAVEPSKSKIENRKFPDGVWLLELAPITEGELVARLLADLFQLPEFPGRTPLDAVITYLQHKALLLIVDNCEHLIATCADLVDRLLRASATLHILATSREVLNTAGEREWTVLPLPTPTRAATDESAWPLSHLQTFAAAQLFIERAQAVKADLSFTDQDASLIAHICQQVDGIPLVLELAAARCKSFSLQEIVARLHDRFALLSGGRRTVLLRHQTLRATIEWSYDLLSPAESALFCCLAVFAGGWTVAAAEQVADQGLGHPPTFDLLHQLVNKSLVIVDHRGETTRYRMLETIREYAREKLVEQGEEAVVCDQHAAYFLQLAEQARPLLYSAEQHVWYQRLIAEQSNFRAALHWWRANNHYTQVARLGAALCWFWWKHGDIREEAHWSEWALTEMDRHRATTPSAVYAKALYSVGFSADCLGNYARACSLYEEYLQIEPQPNAFIDLYEVLGGLADIIDSEGDFQQATILEERRLALSREHAFPNGVADALMQLAHQALSQGDTERASQFLQESLTLCKAVGTITGVAHTQAILGVVACEQGNFVQAWLLLHEALELSRTLDDKHGIGWIFSDLGVVAQLQQTYEKADHFQRKALAMAYESGHQFMIALVLGRLGNLALIQGDLERAHTHYTESLASCRQLGAKARPAVGLEGLAGVAAFSGRPREAAHLLGAAGACRQAIGRILPIEQRAIYERTVAVARATLGEAQFEAAFSTGQTTALDDVITLALAVLQQGLATPVHTTFVEDVPKK
jgi:predicted ATPase/transcriptional regulator with XRE-family HTH domain